MQEYLKYAPEDEIYGRTSKANKKNESGSFKPNSENEFCNIPTFTFDDPESPKEHEMYIGRIENLLAELKSLADAGKIRHETYKNSKEEFHAFMLGSRQEFQPSINFKRKDNLYSLSFENFPPEPAEMPEEDLQYYLNTLLGYGIDIGDGDKSRSSMSKIFENLSSNLEGAVRDCRIGYSKDEKRVSFINRSYRIPQIGDHVSVSKDFEKYKEDGKCRSCLSMGGSEEFTGGLLLAFPRRILEGITEIKIYNPNPHISSYRREDEHPEWKNPAISLLAFPKIEKCAGVDVKKYVGRIIDGYCGSRGSDVLDRTARYPSNFQTLDPDTHQFQFIENPGDLFLHDEKLYALVNPKRKVTPKIGDVIFRNGISSMPYFKEQEAYTYDELIATKTKLAESEDMKMLINIYSKYIHNQPLDKDEIIFIYEVVHHIESRSFVWDRRIEEIRKSRDHKVDASIAFECLPEEIAWKPEEINKKTKVYVGSLFEEVFLAGLENIYTSFPGKNLITENMKKLNKIYLKHIDNQPLNKDELVFIYEVDHKIEGNSGHYLETSARDRRIEEIRKSRDHKVDASIAFECLPEEIAWKPEEINKKTKVYIGQLFKGIFDKKIKIFTSFPGDMIELGMIEVGGRTKEELEKEMKANNNIIDSEYTPEMLENPDFLKSLEKRLDISETINFVRLKIKDILNSIDTYKGNKYLKPSELLGNADDIDIQGQPDPFTKGLIADLGLKVLPAEFGLYLCLNFKKTLKRKLPWNKRMSIAMKPINQVSPFSKTPDPRIFCLFSRSSSFTLTSRRFDPENTLHSDEEIILRL